MKRTVTLLGTAAFAVAIFAFVHPASAADWGKVSAEEWDATAPAEFPSANAIYLFANGEYIVRPDWQGGVELNHHYRLKVLTPAGVDEAGNYSFSYYSIDKVTGFEAHTITPDGKKHKVDKNAVTEKAVRGSKIRSLAFPNVSPGCILEVKYSVKSEYQSNLDTWYFQHDFYTLQSTLSLSHNDRYEYAFNPRNLTSQAAKPTEERVLDARSIASGAGQAYLYTFTWHVENLMPVPEEPYQSYPNDYRSSLWFALAGYHSPGVEQNYLKSWSQLGEEISKVLERYLNKKDDIARLAQTITAGLTDPRAQSRALYEYVISEYQTSSALAAGDKISELLEKKTGSGEDKNLLLVQLHRALGLQSWPLWIGTRNHRRFDATRADLSQFNYTVAVVQLDSTWEFLDAASRYYPYGILTPNCLAPGGFLIDGANSDLIRMTIQPARSMRIDTTRMLINADHSVRCSTTTVYSGYTASSYAERYDTHTPEEFAKTYYLERVGVPCHLLQQNCAADTLDQFISTIVMSSDDLLEDLDGNLLVKPVSFTFRKNPFTSEHRFTPIDFIHPFQYKNVLHVLPATAPGGYDLPPDTTIDIGGASFTRRSTLSDSGATLETVLTVTQPFFSPGEYARVKEFFDQVARSLNDEIALLAESQE